MSTSEARPAAPKFKYRWLRYRLWVLLPVTLIAIIGLWLWHYYAWTVPGRMDREIGATIDSLARKRPPAMTRGQWASAVAWTHNLHGNSLLFVNAKVEGLQRFQCSLQERVERDVDMSTILWIWDEYAKLTSEGEWYREHYRKVMLDEINQVQPNDDP